MELGAAVVKAAFVCVFGSTCCAMFRMRFDACARERWGCASLLGMCILYQVVCMQARGSLAAKWGMGAGLQTDNKHPLPSIERRGASTPQGWLRQQGAQLRHVL